MEAKHFSIHIESTNLPQDVWKIVKNIRENWTENDIRFKVFTDGITNKLIGCYHVDEPDHIILTRVYGEKTDLYIDRSVEVQNFKLMHSRGYAPTLFATFDNGMVYEYIHGDVLDSTSCRDKTIFPLVASMLAKVHKLRYKGNEPLIPVVWEKCECLVNLIPDSFSTSEKQSKFNQHFPGGKAVFLDNLRELKTALQNSDNPIVFCHNDLLLANIVHSGKSVSFIDFEYAGYNYQAYDIANHFNEFAGVTEFDSSLYPSDEFQLTWIRMYLKEYFGNGVASDEKVEILHEYVRKFTPVSHFFWAMWSLVQMHHSFIDFDYAAYAVSRYEEYKKSVKYIHS